VQGPGQSWNFLVCDVGSGHDDAGADATVCMSAHLCQLCCFFLIDSDQHIPEYGCS